MSDVRAVIFDLDGTLTEPVLDFDAIRREIGVDGPILEALESLDAAGRRRAERILGDHEDRAARESRLRPGAHEVVRALERGGVRTAILTRNTRRSLETVLQIHGLRFDALRTREDGPTKPLPDPVLDLCEALDVPPGAALVVGDYRFDLEAARAAGATAVLLRGPASDGFENLADVVVDGLDELLDVVFPASEKPTTSGRKTP